MIKRLNDETYRPAIPIAWNWTTLAESVQLVSDEGKRLDQRNYCDHGPLSVVDQGQDLIGGYTTRADLTYAGPLPVITFGDHTRRVKFIDFRFVVGAQGVKLLHPLPCWDPRFLAYLLSFLPLPDRGYSRHFQFLKSIQFPMPPLAEQRRIVAAIEQHFSRLDAAVAALQRARANLKRYRASVLKAACEGRLVPTEAELARAEGRDYEPADVLLQRILAERRAKWEADELAKMQAKGKAPKDDRWKAKYEEPLAVDPDGLPALPGGWTWSTVGQLGAVGEQAVLTGPFGSNLGREDFVECGVLVLTIGCLTHSGIDSSRAVFVAEAKAIELARYRLAPGDFLFSRMASVGRAGFVTHEFAGAMFNYHIMRLRLASDVLLPGYFLAYVRGSSAVRTYVREVNHGATRDGINTEQLLSMPVAVPPLLEQSRIVDEVERHLSRIDVVDGTIDHSLKQAERLRQAILKRAFEGKLVPQDPNDEPAGVLLERIRAEREQSGGRANGKVKAKTRGRRGSAQLTMPLAGEGES